MRAYERLLKYVAVHTTSDPNSETHPTTHRQFELANMLVEEMKALGIEDARVDDKCYVYGTLAATEGILCGISSGAALWGALTLAKQPENEGKTIVTLLPDTGERYLSTPLYHK